MVKLPKLGKWNPDFVISLIFIKVDRAFRKGNRKVPRKLFHTHYSCYGHNGNKNWDFGIFEQCKLYAYLKERETFW